MGPSQTSPRKMRRHPVTVVNQKIVLKTGYEGAQTQQGKEQTRGFDPSGRGGGDLLGGGFAFALKEKILFFARRDAWGDGQRLQVSGTLEKRRKTGNCGGRAWTGPMKRTTKNSPPEANGPKFRR